jgi:hypothetical protein
MQRAGAVAERLGRGLQSLVQRFESAPRLPSETSLSRKAARADKGSEDHTLLLGGG